jgi:hypothetical protein
MSSSSYEVVTVAGAGGFTAGTNSVKLQARSPYSSSVCRVYGSSEYTGITVLEY